VAGIQFASCLGGTLIYETIFALPGIGRYIYEEIANRDYPVVQGVTIVIATIFVVVSMTVDILYAVLDPRLRTKGYGRDFLQSLPRMKITTDLMDVEALFHERREDAI
jgi:peptide/nickel transport system permease protein